MSTDQAAAGGASELQREWGCPFHSGVAGNVRRTCMGLPLKGSAEFKRLRNAIATPFELKAPGIAASSGLGLDRVREMREGRLKPEDVDGSFMYEVLFVPE